MPAIIGDPTAPTTYRVSGAAPYPVPGGRLPDEITPRQVVLRDRLTTATLVPFSSPQEVPPKLTAYLCDMLNDEIEGGDTYPMSEAMPQSSFAAYWFANFGAVMLLGEVQNTEEITKMEQQGVDWAEKCLGSFYIKPNYPGRSSHVCNGGFLVTDAARNRGVGRLMGEGYLEWAPKLGYSYSVFNLVYETNVASLRIWDALGFKRIGRVPACGNLKSYPDAMIDAIIFGKDLGGDSEDPANEERFDKIRFYLKNGTYPNGSDRAEKSRLRSAATHYRLVPNTTGDGEEDKLMLKGKEVVADPHKQYEIARNIHIASHGGINKTTATISEKYHWVRIKETVCEVIRNCSDCKTDDKKKFAVLLSDTNPFVSNKRRSASTNAAPPSTRPRMTVTAGSDDLVAGASPYDHQQMQQQDQEAAAADHRQTSAPTAPMATMQYNGGPGTYPDMPVDPQIMQGLWNTAPQESMLVNGTNGDNEAEEAEADARLRETLEAQIMTHDYGNQNGHMGR